VTKAALTGDRLSIYLELSNENDPIRFVLINSKGTTARTLRLSDSDCAISKDYVVFADVQYPVLMTAEVNKGIDLTGTSVSLKRLRGHKGLVEFEDLPESTILAIKSQQVVVISEIEYGATILRELDDVSIAD
jgi:hypothetical protein